MKRDTKRLGVLTGGGDAPGLNAVIRAVVKSALNFGWQVFGIRQGFEGLLNINLVHRIRPQDVRGILHLGGTILGTTNRGNPFKYPVKTKNGVQEKDISDKAVKNFKKLGLDALVVIGGDGTLKIAYGLYKKGVPVTGVPKTIDNDLSATVITFGFDTAVSTATEALDKLHSTAESHQRVMVVEVMGRYAGWIALSAGVAGGADVILIPEIPFDIEKVCQKINERYRRHRSFAIVVAAEGAKPKDGKLFVMGEKEAGREAKLGGIAEWLSKELQNRTGHESRYLVLGHLQRGGNPTTFDRLVATRFGAAAVRLIEKRQFGKMVALDPPFVKAVPLKKAVSRMKSVPLNSDTIVTARQLGISFGD